MHCSWMVGDKLFDLSKLKSRYINATDNRRKEYYYTPCINGIECKDGMIDKIDAMVSLSKDRNDKCEHYYATWDDSVKPTYSNTLNVLIPDTNVSPTLVYPYFTVNPIF